MKKKLLEIASTQYKDYKGIIEVDGHMGLSLLDICKNINFNLDMYFPIAFSIGENGINRGTPSTKVMITIFAVKKKIAGNDFDSILSYAKKKKGTLNVIRHNAVLNYSDLNKYFKRYSIFLLQSGLEGIVNSFEIKEDYGHSQL